MPLSQELRQSTFNYMGAFIICFLTYKVLEGNYKMIEPHLRTLCVDRNGPMWFGEN
jgi:hypothetical protein